MELLRELEEIKTMRSELLSVRRERMELQQQTRGLMKVVQVRKRERGKERERERVMREMIVNSYMTHCSHETMSL